MSNHVFVTLIMVLLSFFFSPKHVGAQETAVFLDKVPSVDGKRDVFISDHQMLEFKDIYFNGEEYDDSGAMYFLGYTSHHLYIYIESKTGSIVCRDRAYQNGDGFHLTLGKAKADSGDMDEFYVLGFSPSNDWTRKIVWYYNVDLSMKRLGNDVLFETHEGHEKAGFELLIPWNVLHPYHPWFDQDIGFNLCFVKAVNEQDKLYHFIKTDARMQSEQSKRKYVKLDFNRPHNADGFYAMPVRNNYTTGDPIEIKLAGYSRVKAKKSFLVEVLSEDETIYTEAIEVEFNKGFDDLKYKLRLFSPNAGDYTLRVLQGKDVAGKSRMSVFEEFDCNRMRTLLSGCKKWMAEGTFNSLMFYVNELVKERSELKDYEASSSVSAKIDELKQFEKKLKMYADPFDEKRGTFRRAFMSESDQTLQPYSVYVPEDYNPAKVYPLLVYLHGSGQDDRALITANFIKKGFIVVAPNGRGTSNCYATAEALTDIREAIDDVQKSYNIDAGKIILSGFSMGGYGVYRALYEYPELFHAAAVLSGHPNLASGWGMGNPVDFRDSAVLSRLPDIPFFIYHGRQDGNCPYDLTHELVSKLKNENGKVLFVTDENAGHGSMNEQINTKYIEWLIEAAAD